MNGLTLFKRMHSNGTPIDSWVLLSWHHPKSLTWRFGLTYSGVKSGRSGVYFFKTHKYAKGLNFHSVINLPLFGSLTLETQPHMFNKGNKE